MINSKEKKLLDVLRRDARISITKLAQLLNLSRTTAQTRLNKLEESGIIKGYRVELGDQYQNSLVSASVSITVMQKLTTKTNQKLQSMLCVYELYAISGEYDFIAIVKAESLPELNQMIDEIGNLEGVERTNTSIILETKLRR